MADSDYLIGRGKPPLGSRFKPGVSGNPSGRPKRTPTLQTDLLDELARPAAASGNDTKQRAIIRALVNQATAGNLRAISVLVALLARMQGRNEESAEQLSDHDREILEQFAQRELGTTAESASADEANVKGDHQGRVP